jgi:tRNA G37 N-methylase TrmD
LRCSCSRQWHNVSMSTTFTNRLGITITVTPEQVEELIAIGLSEKEVLALLTGDFEGVDEARIVEIIESSNVTVS